MMLVCFVRSSHLDPCRSFPFYHRSEDQHIAAHKGSWAHNAWLDLSSRVFARALSAWIDLISFKSFHKASKAQSVWLDLSSGKTSSRCSILHSRCSFHNCPPCPIGICWYCRRIVRPCTISGLTLPILHILWVSSLNLDRQNPVDKFSTLH